MPVYTLPELPYDYAALAPVISPEIIELHHDKHHAAYVKGANDTLEQLAGGRQGVVGSGQRSGEEPGLPSPPATSCTAITWTNMSGTAAVSPSPWTVWRARGRDHRVVRLLHRVQGAADEGRRDHPGLRLGRPRPRSRSAVASSSSRSTTTRATSGRGRCRSWCSTPGSTPSTCSTATRRSTSSTRCGRSSTGRTRPGVTRRPRPARTSSSCFYP